MAEILRHFIKSERIGNQESQLHSLHEMLPHFTAVGAACRYAKYSGKNWCVSVYTTASQVTNSATLPAISWGFCRHFCTGSLPTTNNCSSSCCTISQRPCLFPNLAVDGHCLGYRRLLMNIGQWLTWNKNNRLTTSSRSSTEGAEMQPQDGQWYDKRNCQKYSQKCSLACTECKEVSCANFGLPCMDKL